MKARHLALAAGFGLFLWLVQRIGLGTVARQVGRVGWGFALVIGLEGVSLAISTLAWKTTLSPAANVPFRSLFAMRLAGDAVNAVAPAAVVGGEILRARLLAAFVPVGQAIASVSLAALAQFLAQALYVACGSFAIPEKLLPPAVRWAGGAALGLLALTLARWARPRALSSDSRSAPARWARILLPVAGSSERRASLQGRVAEALRSGRRRLPLSVALFLAGWGLTAVEVALILSLLGASVPVRTAFSIAVCMVFIEGVFFFVPARVGVAEGGLYATFRFFGLDPATGFSLAIVRRARELAWALAGLAVLARRRPPAETTEPEEKCELRIEVRGSGG